MPVSTVGVQCADQGITLNSKELLLAESGSASLTSMISAELSAFMLASVMQSLAPAEQNLPLTEDEMPLHWFGMFITSKQQKWKHNVLLSLFFLPFTPQSRSWIEEEHSCKSFHYTGTLSPAGCVENNVLLKSNGFACKTWSLLACLLACHLLMLQYNIFPIRKWDAEITPRGREGWSVLGVCGCRAELRAVGSAEQVGRHLFQQSPWCFQKEGFKHCKRFLHR